MGPGSSHKCGEITPYKLVINGVVNRLYVRLWQTFLGSRTPPNVDYLPYLPKHSTTKTIDKNKHYVLKISEDAKFSPQNTWKRYSSYWANEEILLGAPYSHVRKQQTCHHRTALLLLLSGDVNFQTLVTIYTNANTQDDYTICIVWETWVEKCESESNCKLFQKYPNTQCMLYFLACTIEIRPFL